MTTSAICHESDFYTIGNNLRNISNKYKVDDPLILENHFSKTYETKYSKLIEKIKKGHSLDVKEAKLLAYTVFTIKIRNKFYGENAVKNIIPSILDDLYQEVLSSFDKDSRWERFPNLTKKEALATLDKVVKENREDEDLVKDFHLMTFFKDPSREKSTPQKFTEHLLQFKWILAINVTGLPFITTDNPGFCVTEGDQVYNIRFQPPFFFFLPLGPEHLLFIDGTRTDDNFITSGMKEITRRSYSKDFVTITNKAALFNTNGKFFSNSSSNFEYLLDFYCDNVFLKRREAQDII